MTSPASCDRWWLLTWTTYGTWLPGDQRGFVSPHWGPAVKQRRHNRAGTPYDSGLPALLSEATSNLKGEPIYLVLDQAQAVYAQFEETIGYRS